MRTNKIIFLLLIFVGCSNQTEEAAEYAAEPEQHAEQTGLLEQEDEEEAAEGVDEEVLAVTQQTFMGYDCTIDCSGHEAGYQWAEQNSIDDPDNCDGNSNSFNEGCQSYVEEQQ